jgi:hypothetical protein
LRAKKLRELGNHEKETQRSLGFTGKDVDGDREFKTNAAIKTGRAKITSYLKILLCQI